MKQDTAAIIRRSAEREREAELEQELFQNETTAQALEQLATDLDSAVDDFLSAFRPIEMRGVLNATCVPINWFSSDPIDPSHYPALPKDYQLENLVRDIYRLQGYALRLKGRNG